MSGYFAAPAIIEVGGKYTDGSPSSAVRFSLLKKPLFSGEGHGFSRAIK
jgi:hypothetical protein